MRSRLAAAIAVVTSAALVLAGCSVGGDAGSDPNNPNQVEAIPTVGMAALPFNASVEIDAIVEIDV